MQEKNCCFAFASYYVFDSESRKKGIVLAPSSVSLIDTKRDDKIGFLTAVYDTSFYGKFYMPTLRKRQDWAYVLQILQKCGHAYSLREPLAYYRRAKGSISHNKFSLIKYNAKVYSTVFGYSVLHSYCYLFTMFLPAYALKVINNKIINMRYEKRIK